MRARQIRSGRAAAMGLTLALLPAVALAGEVSLPGAVALSRPQGVRNANAWSAERLRAARPLPIPEVSFDTAAVAAEGLAAGEAVKTDGAPGRPPLAGIRPVHRRLFDPLAGGIEGLSGGLGSVAEPAKGSANGYYTSARLIPEDADLEYPYSAVGVLFFNVPGEGDFFCSAAVIQARIVATAAQCVHSGTSNPGFYDDLLFVPAYRDGDAPFSSWDAAYVLVHSSWASGGGNVPHAADYALIEMVDQVYNGALRKVAQVTGSLGYATKKLRPNHAHLLGYSTSHDSASIMHQVTAQSLRAASSNNVEYGSDMRSGSQGGPLIQDFSDSPSVMRWIGALSYFNNNTAVKVQGASTPDDRFTALKNAACGHRAGNCP